MMCFEQIKYMHTYIQIRILCQKAAPHVYTRNIRQYNKTVNTAKA